jgi:hypothetical protein
VCTAIFRTFSCVDVDPNNEIGGSNIYLTADLSLSCTSEKYHFGRTWAIGMIFVYPIVSIRAGGEGRSELLIVVVCCYSFLGLICVVSLSLSLRRVFRVYHCCTLFACTNVGMRYEPAMMLLLGAQKRRKLIINYLRCK